MTLETFDKELKESQVIKGHDYFYSRAVSIVKEQKRGTWHALVEGSEEYFVEVKLRSGTIVSTYCDCPHDVSYCKHVIAVLYAIREKKGATTVPDTSIEEHIAAYSKIIKRILKEDEDRAYKYEDNYDTADLRKDLEGLLKFAKAYTAEKKFAKAAGITIALIDGVGHMFGYMDRSGVVAYDCSKEAFVLLDKICSLKIPVTLRNKLFERGCKQIEYSGDFEANWHELAISAAHNKTTQKRLLDQLNAIETSLTKLDEITGTTKVRLLIKMGEQAKAEETLAQYAAFLGLRKRLVLEAIEQKEFDRAFKYVNDGILFASANKNNPMLYTLKNLLDHVQFEFESYQRRLQREKEERARKQA